ncbi:TFIIB-type zinc ribbon-containing protein [Methanosalsum zhilinae]|nr:zf-TFIIB domain-containing protein [Methanosalsum zhilinae]
MKALKNCPKCSTELKTVESGGIQVCNVCRYWTKHGTARIDSIMIFA